MTAILRTEGVVLRPLTVADAKALFLAHGDPDAHQYWSGPAHRDEAETARSIEQTLTVIGADAWAITEDGEDALGRIALFIRREGVGELGVILRREAQGRGIAAKALKLVEAYAFEALKLHRLFADVDPENGASMSLFLRAGFQREGLLKQNWKTHIGLRDTVILAKLKEPQS
ncbi:MAG TPA: GNAT family N-acetyltransferase [Caulobacterales bacterium]|nr:GNAT family N-acetyltransferase [Caulobacterales bacterium]